MARVRSGHAGIPVSLKDFQPIPCPERSAGERRGTGCIEKWHHLPQRTQDSALCAGDLQTRGLGLWLTVLLGLQPALLLPGPYSSEVPGRHSDPWLSYGTGDSIDCLLCTQRPCSRALKECGSSWKVIGHTQADETVTLALRTSSQ